MQPEARAVDRGEGDLVVAGRGGCEESPDLLHTADGGEPVGGGRAHEREGVPIACEDVLGEAAETTVTDAHGRGGKAINVCAVEERALQCQIG